MASRALDHESCRTCRFFLDDPHRLESEFAGIIALSSAYGSTRGSAGICAVTQRFHDPLAACRDFAPKEESDAAVTDR